MKLKTFVACTAVAAFAINTSHGAPAAGNYTITQIDADSGLPRSSAYLISDNGVVAGQASDDYDSKAFIWTDDDGFSLISFGGTQSSAFEISSNGIVIGAAQTPGDAEIQGFAWTATGGVTPIEGLGGTQTFPSDVNSSGVVVGDSDTANGETHPFVWTGAGPAVDLGGAGFEGTARFVTDDGLIVGTYRPATDDEAPSEEKVGSSMFAITPSQQYIEVGKYGLDMYPERMNRRGAVIGVYLKGEDSFGSFFWSIETGLINLSAGATGDVIATELSDNDIVVGYKRTAAGYVGFQWTLANGFVAIPSLGGSATFPNAVNSSGLVTGYSSTSKKKGSSHAFAWTRAGGMVDLGTLQGGEDSFGHMVTEDGMIIGSSDARGKKPTRAFVWTRESGMVELPSLGGHYDAVTAVNANGVIAGLSSFKSKKFVDERAVIWTPADLLGSRNAAGRK